MRFLRDLIVSGFMVLAPIKAAAISIIVLSLADMILGIAAAIKRKEPITSAGLRRTVVKLLVFEAALIFGYIAEHFLIGHEFPVFKIVSSLIGLTELTSILENLNEISGTNIFKSLISRMGSKNE